MEFIAIFMGSLILAFFFLWTRNREEIEADNASNFMRNIGEEDVQSNAAVLVTSQYGTLLHINNCSRLHCDVETHQHACMFNNSIEAYSVISTNWL